MTADEEAKLMKQITRLPIIHGGPTIAGQEVIVDKARQLFEMMIVHPEQKRAGPKWNSTLAKVALHRVKSMAEDNWVGHIDMYGAGPNYWARSFGYRLPAWWPDAANQIESLSHGGEDTEESGGIVMQTWRGLLASPGHRIHLLGLDPFYAKQTNVGIGYYYLESSEYKHYWSIITAPPEGE